MLTRKKQLARAQYGDAVRGQGQTVNATRLRGMRGRDKRGHGEAGPGQAELRGVHGNLVSSEMDSEELENHVAHVNRHIIKHF